MGRSRFSHGPPYLSTALLALTGPSAFLKVLENVGEYSEVVGKGWSWSRLLGDEGIRNALFGRGLDME